MELDDKVSIVLTEVGADYLNALNSKGAEALCKILPPTEEYIVERLYPTNHHNGMVLNLYLFEVFNLFRNYTLCEGGTKPFTAMTNYEDQRINC